MHQTLLANFLLQASPSTEAGAEQINPWQLVLHASSVVQAVLVILTLMGLFCIFIMGAKALRVFAATRASRRFLDLFWGAEQGPDWTNARLEGVYAEIKAYAASPVASVFRAGYVELARIGSAQAAGQNFAGVADIENVARALRRTANNELTALETMLPFLATTASTAPFIGLFGTVIGIMNSFIAISGNHNASLDVVAPGIAEALIATAIGLMAAIPAVMAYNFFNRRIRVLESEMESFSNDYLNIVRRHFLKG